VSRRLAAVFGLALLIVAQAGRGAEATEADPCREQFVACVTETGDPLACHAVSAACRTEAIPKTESLDDLATAIRMEQRDGQAYARLTITNQDTKPVTVAAIPWDFNCPDGTVDTLYFVFQRTLEPAEQLRSYPTIACYGQGVAEAAQRANSQAVGLSSETVTFYCDRDQTRSVAVRIFPDGRLHYTRNDGVSGQYRSERADGLDLVNTVCTNWKGREDDEIRKLRKHAIAELQKLFARAGIKPTTANGKGMVTSTGSRN